MSEKYLIGKEYLENAIIRAYIDGGTLSDNPPSYADNVVDDMIRGDKPFNDTMSEYEEQTIEILNKRITELERSATLRDQFAMAALTGHIAMYAHPESGEYIDHNGTSVECYAIADAMMKARNTPNKEDE